MVALQDRQRIIDAYRQGEDYVAVAHHLGVRRTTAWSVVAKWLRTEEVNARPRGGCRARKVDEEMLDFFIMMIEADPTITLKRLNDSVREVWPDKPRVSVSTINRALHGSLISVKQTRNIPVDRNTPTTKQQRRQ